MLEQEKGPDYAFFPEGATREYKVSELLDGVRREPTRSREEAKRETRTPVVVLVHGIRTRALWQNAIQSTLRKEGFVVQPTNHEHFDVLRFLFPSAFFRRRIVKEVERQIRHTLAEIKAGTCSLIAHSFGTYVVAQICASTPTLNSIASFLRQRRAAKLSFRGLPQALQHAPPERGWHARRLAGDRRGRHLRLRLRRGRTASAVRQCRTAGITGWHMATS